MSLFTLGNINFSAGGKIRGPLDALAGSKYGLNTFKYPSDLGASDKGHYMVIYINEQVKTQFPGAQAVGDEPAVIANARKMKNTYGATTLMQGLGTIVNGAQTIPGIGQAVSTYVGKPLGALFNASQNSDNKLLQGVNSVGTTLLKILDEGLASTGETGGIAGVRTIRRITDTVALYMPDSLVFNTNQAYSNPDTGGSLFQAGVSGLSSVVDSIKSGKTQAGTAEDITRNLSPFFANYVAQSTNAGKVIFSSLFGVVQNPMLEILYSSPSLRDFQFDFVFYPRAEGEAREVQNIIDRLKFHQAPEIMKGSGGYFLIPPSEFDIKFMYNGKQNPNIPEISTCVLKSISVNYAPHGFSAYETEGEPFPNVGRTGMPVAIQMSLNFTETQYLTKDYYSSAANPMLRDTGAGTTINSSGQTINNDYAMGT